MFSADTPIARTGPCLRLPDVVVDEKYKGFWEEEIIAHDKTKEEIIKLKDILKHIGGAGSDDNNDIYGDENKSKGRWGGGSNIKGNK